MGKKIDHYVLPVKFGVNLVVIRDGQVLMGLRKNIVGDGFWGLPGGRMEPDEQVMEAGKRELTEETGLKAKELVFLNTAVQHQGGGRWVQFGFIAYGITGKVENREPECCAELKWFPIDKLPKNIFRGHHPHFKALKDNKSIFIEEAFEL